MKAITLQFALEIHYDCSFNLVLDISSQQFSTINVDNIKTPGALYTNIKIHVLSDFKQIELVMDIFILDVHG